MIPLTNMVFTPLCIHFQQCKLTVLHCTHLRNGIQLPWNDSSVQSICSNTKPYSVHPGLRWRYVRQGLYGGKVASILCSDWPPAQTRWSDLAFSALLTLFLREKKNFFILSCNIILFYPFLTKLVLSTYWPHSFFWLISNYLVPWPHTWSIG